MALTSARFLAFAAAVLLAYYTLPGKWQWGVLLAASCLFYVLSGPEYLVFLAITTVSTYLFARAMEKNKALGKAEAKKKNRPLLIALLVLNFGILLVCKALLIQPFAALAAGTPLSFLSAALPMGISFYMFQSMGYAVDVYRGTGAAEPNFGKFALFVTYFPQLIQGPISRFKQLAPQLTAQREFDGKTVAFGLERMLWGYFKKLVIADRMMPAVMALRGAEGGGAFLLLGAAYAVQIYGDFTGGIDIIMGFSQALGITLTENFQRPFFSKNIAEYWRRWHISLGEWIKEYVFYPISVSAPIRKLSKAARKKYRSLGKRLPVYAATIATWLVTGVWHGLTPNFVVWGMLNCVVIIVSQELTPLYRKFHARFGWKEKPWYGAFEMVRMFALMNLIRACDLFPNVGEYFRRLGSIFTPWLWRPLPELGLAGLDWVILALGGAVCFAVSWYQERRGSVREKLLQGNCWVRYGMIFALLLAVLLLGRYGVGYEASTFIYNQF